MSIEPDDPERQARAPEAAAPTASSAAAEKPDAGPRRIFICYTRAAKDEVASFQEMLEKRLAVRSRAYRVFRDKGSDRNERINTGEDYKKVIRDKLAESVCCIVALVPSIFESDECAEEVAQYRDLRIKNGSGFFFPVVFSPIGEEMKARAASGNAIATILRTVDRVDLSEYQFAGDRRQLEGKVDEIADTMHHLILRQLTGDPVPASGALGISGAGGAAARPPWRVVAGVVLAGIVLLAGLAALRPAPMVGLWQRLFGPPVVVVEDKPQISWQAVTAPLDLVLPVRTFLEPKLGGKEGPALGPDQRQEITAVREASIQGIAWYEVALGERPKLYFTKDQIPVWTDTDPNLELIEPVEVRAMPLATSAPEPGTLSPDAFAASRARRAPRRAAIGGDTWMRVALANPTRDAFFSLAANQALLVQWTPVQGCLIAKGLVRARDGIANGGERESFSPGEWIPTAVAQSARVGGRDWIRYKHAAADSRYLYVPSDEVRIGPCG